MAAEKEAPELKAALRREREEAQHLLADSYAAVMDLTKQLQINERNWSREKLELLERFNQERAQWEQRLRDTQAKAGQVSCQHLHLRLAPGNLPCIPVQFSSFFLFLLLFFMSPIYGEIFPRQWHYNELPQRYSVSL